MLYYINYGIIIWDLCKKCWYLDYVSNVVYGFLVIELNYKIFISGDDLMFLVCMFKC